MFIKGMQFDEKEKKTDYNSVIKEIGRKIKGECIQHLSHGDNLRISH